LDSLHIEEHHGLGLIVNDGQNELKSYRFLDVAKIDDETGSFVSWNGKVLGRFFVKQQFLWVLRTWLLHCASMLSAACNYGQGVA